MQSDGTGRVVASTFLEPSAGSGRARLTYHFLLAVDIEGFSRLCVLDQVRAQIELAHALHTACERSDLDRGAWWRQPAGDGELAVLPADVDGLRLVADYPRELNDVLTEINLERPPEQRLRVRLAIHHGTLVEGIFGPAGHAPIVVSRLLDSDELRRELRDAPELDLALIVSAQVYEEIIESRMAGLDPGVFHPLVVTAKGKTYVAYTRRMNACVAREIQTSA
ncbi:hypothetical protein ACGFNU_40945 [Spirillospora sp. NPDC048911]|uniref:hypothetical protein n=1 Tax=Spirillospora sp. NPDC048911 TaxID=3364527 RepID=UPI00372105F3